MTCFLLPHIRSCFLVLLLLCRYRTAALAFLLLLLLRTMLLLYLLVMPFLLLHCAPLPSLSPPLTS
jgi:hypothetical protein